MGLVLDAVALLSQLGRPRYGRSLVLAGADLPRPERTTFATRHGRVRCLRYPGVTSGRLLHLHGGAFVTRYPQMDDFWARFVVATTGVEVYLADYDVAPQARYPVAHEQVFDVTAALGADAPVVVGGFSGGGNLAAAAALWAAKSGRTVLAGSLLGVPALDVSDDIATKLATAPGGMLTASTLRLARDTYFKDALRRREPPASPLHAPDVRNLPPTMIVTAERDVLRAEGDAYAQRLRLSGVPTEHIVAHGVDHYFLHGAGVEQARGLMRAMAEFVARCLDQSAADDRVPRRPNT